MAELTPTSKPRTKAEALEMAQKWGSDWSHWNQIADLVSSPEAPGGVFVVAATAQADAAEVQRLAALHSMLPEEGPNA